MIPLPDPRDEIREWLTEVVRMARAPTGPNGDAPPTNEELVDYAMTSTVVSRLSAPEPAETAPREPDAMCHATHWRQGLDEPYGQLTVRPYDPEKCSSEGPPWPVWIGVAPPLGSPAPTPRPMECSVCGAGYIGSRAGEECGVEGCDGRLYFVVAEASAGERRPLAVTVAERIEMLLNEDMSALEIGHDLVKHIGLSRSPAPTAAEPEREAPTPEKLRAMAEWFDDPANPGVDVVVGFMTPGHLLRRIADALALCALATPEAEGGST